jgi:transposase-like protein
MKFTMKQFNDRFPTNEACLEELKQLRFGNEFACQKCGSINKHYKVTGRMAYACKDCGNHVYPMAGTIFQDSQTALKTWYFAIYLMAQTRAGISAKQLERMTGVTYKTAWRMFKQIRSMMTEDGGLLSGTVEVDETYVGGRAKYGTGRKGPTSGGKIPVVGLVERGGRIRTKAITTANLPTVMPIIRKNVAEDANLMTDDARYYWLASRFYNHQSINHSKPQYAIGNVHTNTIEGFWSHLKLGIRAVYRHVDPKYLQYYANEYAFRYSNRKHETPMFDLILEKIAPTPING